MKSNITVYNKCFKSLLNKGFVKFFIILSLIYLPSKAQDTTVAFKLVIGNTDSNVKASPTFKPPFVKNKNILSKQQINNRSWIIGTANVAGYGGALAGLYSTWYSNYPQSKLHAFNDIKEWQQMDKIGHAWTAYNTSKVSAAMWKWTGIKETKAELIGAISGTTYLTAIEILDGFSKEWGWSWGDMGANVFGGGLYAWQELAWDEQKIQFKFSFHKKKYNNNSQLVNRANTLYGKEWYSRMLKDYNAQTYWLCVSPGQFSKTSKWPKWLNVSVGYGADNMFGGFDNIAKDNLGNITFDRRDLKRYRQFYFAPDIDLTKIKTKSKTLKFLFTFFNSFKFPMPSLELSNGKLKVNAISF